MKNNKKIIVFSGKQFSGKDTVAKIANKKRAKVGMKLDEPKIFMEATIEYDIKGEYYLIKYQRGTVKAWGVFKG